MGIYMEIKNMSQDDLLKYHGEWLADNESRYTNHLYNLQWFKYNIKPSDNTEIDSSTMSVQPTTGLIRFYGQTKYSVTNISKATIGEIPSGILAIRQNYPIPAFGCITRKDGSGQTVYIHATAMLRTDGSIVLPASDIGGNISNMRWNIMINADNEFVEVLSQGF